MYQGKGLADTLSKLLDGELREGSPIGSLLTPGMRIGEKKGSSKLKEEPTNAESKRKCSGVYQLCRAIFRLNDS